MRMVNASRVLIFLIISPAMTTRDGQDDGPALRPGFIHGRSATKRRQVPTRNEKGPGIPA
jgi:hypothetical protein